MNIQRLAYIALKEVLTTNRQEGDILMPLKNKGHNLTDTQVREVADFIETNNLGKKTPISRGRIIIRANSNAADFVKQQEHLPFEQRLRLIYSELLSRPERKGDLEEILNRLGFEHNPHVIREFTDHFKETNHATIFAQNKDFTEVVLNQKGQDFLYAPVEKPIQPNIIFEHYNNSVVAKGTDINQSGISFEAVSLPSQKEATAMPTTDKAQSKSEPGTTKRLQKRAILVAVILFILACIFNYLLKKEAI